MGCNRSDPDFLDFSSWRSIAGERPLTGDLDRITRPHRFARLLRSHTNLSSFGRQSGARRTALLEFLLGGLSCGAIGSCYGSISQPDCWTVTTSGGCCADVACVSERGEEAHETASWNGPSGGPAHVSGPAHTRSSDECLSQQRRTYQC